MKIQNISLIGFRNNIILEKKKKDLEHEIRTLANNQADLYNELIEKRAVAKAAEMKYIIAKKESDEARNEVVQVIDKMNENAEKLYNAEDNYYQIFKSIYRVNQKDAYFFQKKFKEEMEY